MKTLINKISGGKIEIVRGVKLNEDQLNALKWYCLNNGIVNFISQAQTSQLARYMMSEADKYPSSHSMKYTIMRGFTYAAILKRSQKS